MAKRKKKFIKKTNWEFGTVTIERVSWNIAFVMTFMYLLNFLPMGKWYIRLGYIIFLLLLSILATKVFPFHRKVIYEEL